MQTLSSLFMHDKVTEVLLLSWADKHPYLFTLIQVTTPTIWIILVVAGFNIVNGVLRGGRR